MDNNSGQNSGSEIQSLNVLDSGSQKIPGDTAGNIWGNKVTSI